MNHIVDMCPLTKFEGGLKLLQKVDNKVTTTANIPSRIRLRSARTHRYEPLTTRLKFGERCFSHAGPKAWNSLPHAVQKITETF